MTHLRAASRRVGAVLLTAALLATSACAEGGPRPLTDPEADRLAESLYSNYEAGGFTFELNAAPTATETVHIEGKVSFVDDLGYGIVNATGEDSSVDAVMFTRDTVLENVTGLADASVALGGPDFVWVARPADSSAYQIDGLLGVVLGLATEQRDNPELVAQNGARWLREDTLRGVTVDVFEYSPQARFWVEHGTTRLMRFEGNNSTLTRPIVIEVLEIGAVTPPEVDESLVVTVDQVADLYEAMRRVPSQ